MVHTLCGTVGIMVAIPRFWTLNSSRIRSYGAKDVDEREFLAKADNTFLISEFVVIVLMLIGLMSSSQAHIQGAQLLLGGPFTAPSGFCCWNGNYYPAYYSVTCC